jgi:hypothetical protein
MNLVRGGAREWLGSDLVPLKRGPANETRVTNLGPAT